MRPIGLCIPFAPHNQLTTRTQLARRHPCSVLTHHDIYSWMVFSVDNCIYLTVSFIRSRYIYAKNTVVNEIHIGVFWYCFIFSWDNFQVGTFNAHNMNSPKWSHVSCTFYIIINWNKSRGCSVNTTAYKVCISNCLPEYLNLPNDTFGKSIGKCFVCKKPWISKDSFTPNETDAKAN